MLVSDFNYPLPEELIAQHPLADRAASRLLHVERTTGSFIDRRFRDFPQLLRPDDLLVLNNTRMFPARLLGRRVGARAQPVSKRNPAARDFLRGEVEALLTRQLSVQIAEITLHVGLGTFQPVRVEEVEEHKMHRERYSIAAEAAEKINTALAKKRRVVAVGTTTVRTLEHAATQRVGAGACISPGSAETNLFIYPGFKFRVVGALLTNFHLPQSTLLMLVSAFAGRELVLKAYRHAVEQKYRFFSYGDCMFIE